MQEVITADAAKIGIDLRGFQATVQLVGTICSPPRQGECGSHGLYTQTELNLTGGDVVGLENTLKQLGFASSVSIHLVGAPHDGFTGNYRQSVLNNSLQVNTNPAQGTAQFDIDPFNPAAGWGLGLILQGGFQMLPNMIMGSDTNYASIVKSNGLSIKCNQ